MPVKPKKAPKGPIIPDDYTHILAGPIDYKETHVIHYMNLF